MIRSGSLILLLAWAMASPVVAQEAPPTPADIEAAMADTSHGWFAYSSDGTPASDTARRFAALALWDWEGGDTDRGLRLLYAAFDRGVDDEVFYHQAALALTTYRRDLDAVRFARKGIDRWPSNWLMWKLQVGPLQRLGRSEEATVAAARADSLRSLVPQNAQ